MAEMNILKSDNRGRVTLPFHFRSEPLFEYIIEGDADHPLTRFARLENTRTCRICPLKELSHEWAEREDAVNKDRRRVFLLLLRPRLLRPSKDREPCLLKPSF